MAFHVLISDTEDVMHRMIIIGVILNFRILTQEALSEVGFFQFFLFNLLSQI